MAKDYNRITIVGRLGKEPEGKYTPDGTFLVRFPIGSTTSSGVTLWKDVTFFGGIAEVINEHAKKGTKVLVGGELRVTTYKTDEGKTRRYESVTGRDFLFLDSKKPDSDDKGSAKPPKDTDVMEEPPDGNGEFPF